MSTGSLCTLQCNCRNVVCSRHISSQLYLTTLQGWLHYLGLKFANLIMYQSRAALSNDIITFYSIYSGKRWQCNLQRSSFHSKEYWFVLIVDSWLQYWKKACIVGFITAISQTSTMNQNTCLNILILS